MSYKDIVVHVDATERSDARVVLAARIAKKHQAHLTGVYVIEPDPVDPLLSTGVPFGAGQPGGKASSKSRTLAAHAERHFNETLAADQVEGLFQTYNGLPEDIVPRRARFADLLIASQSNPEDKIDFGSRVATNTVVGAGRPALVIPYAGTYSAAGSRIVVAWNNTREAARVLNDALPLLTLAEKVVVLAVNPPEEPGTDSPIGGGADVVQHLARHGVKAESARIEAHEIAVGDTLLNRAFDLGADLLVSGAYGHSQLRELLLGGVTRDLFDRMTLPVFMSH